MCELLTSQTKPKPKPRLWHSHLFDTDTAAFNVSWACLSLHHGPPHIFLFRFRPDPRCIFTESNLHYTTRTPNPNPSCPNFTFNSGNSFSFSSRVDRERERERLSQVTLSRNFTTISHLLCSPGTHNSYLILILCRLSFGFPNLNCSTK